jgi:hypothetical protein
MHMWSVGGYGHHALQNNDMCDFSAWRIFTEIPYILESNPHPVFGDFLNEKKLVRDSKPHLSFNHPLPTGRLIE